MSYEAHRTDMGSWRDPQEQMLTFIAFLLLSGNAVY